MQRVLLWVWCFPQNLLGVLLKLFTRAENKGQFYAYRLPSGSVSLGDYIFLCPSHLDDPDVLKHEQGHQKQSTILGWLYLPVIGLPSIVWAGCFAGYRKKHKVSYYDFYTEHWADKLGGVER